MATEPGDAVERGRILRCLDAVGRAMNLTSYRLLAGGVSGVSTYLVELEDDSVVLKLAKEDDELSKARTLREIYFYEQLAARVPLPTPPLVFASADDAAPWLCLRAWKGPPLVAQWPMARYRNIASQLAQLHNAFLGRFDELHSLAWLARHDQPTTPQVIGSARDAWQVLGESHASFFARLPPSTIEGYLTQVGSLDAVMGELPVTLVHGDCHHGNLLIDSASRWAWADWQEVGIGHGPSDLSFLFLRAAMAGAAVPEDDALSSYAENLARPGGSSPCIAAVTRYVHADELRTLLTAWPHFLRFVPPDSLRLALHLLEHLAIEFGLD